MTRSLGRRPLLGLLAATAALPAGAQDAALPSPQDGAGGLTILFCGDSLAQGLYLASLPALRRQRELKLVNGTRHATGLTRADEYDWVEAVREAATRTRPHLMVAWIGANDFRPMVDRATRRRFPFGSPAYAEAYAARVAAMAEHARASGAVVAWLGLPNMREPGFAQFARQLNEIQERGARAGGALWVPSWDATSDPEGQFRASLAGTDRVERRLRADDGVHFSELGYRAIAKLAFTAVAVETPVLALPLAAAGAALAA
ncbi:GDSL-type esterase/lipase family protein [Siccirubricoccus sp. KC 17139]|uniref:GDSL-type esterase/lipase family protein n=1 Tax=Siccirubricoccus soli TaxID=2899147 RepID=A0ABT1DA55_9PROT|nr:GDSL-type esterase/lipase family protein [Siccirubricoccus soli]MCP2684962.1 GDSL-type esterase/lipase family protein [Siccirubricoccus soli]